MLFSLAVRAKLEDFGEFMCGRSDRFQLPNSTAVDSTSDGVAELTEKQQEEMEEFECK